MYILFDIGGTKTRIAISRDGKSLGEPKVAETPKDFGEGISLFKELVHELSGKGKIEAVAGGVAGALNKEKTVLVGATNVPWAGKPLKQQLSRMLEAPVFLENDADLAGLGEAVRGAGKGKQIVVYITVSTGVGGTRIVNGKIDESSAFGFEPGKQVIDVGGTLCGDGFGYLENCVSGNALERRYGKKPYEITDSNVWDKTAKLLAYGLLNTIVHWAPDVIVLGGSMMLGKPSVPLDRINFYLKQVFAQVFTTPHPVPPIVKAALGDASGLYGALVFLKQRL